VAKYELLHAVRSHIGADNDAFNAIRYQTLTFSPSFLSPVKSRKHCCPCASFEGSKALLPSKAAACSFQAFARKLLGLWFRG
jgi:hypothetical protein